MTLIANVDADWKVRIRATDQDLQQYMLERMGPPWQYGGEAEIMLVMIGRLQAEVEQLKQQVQILTNRRWRMVNG